MNITNHYPRKRHSFVGITASLIAVIAWSIVIIYYQSHREIERHDALQEAFIIKSVSVFGSSLILSGISVGLGIGSWFQPYHKRIFGVIGSILGSGMILAFAFTLATTIVVTVTHPSKAPSVIIETSE
jgi:predicted RND superfamily exporter protein